MKIKFGAIVTDGRGKIGGHVASKNRGGAYLRTKVTPSNPNTVAQAQARSLLASLAQGWRGLTDAQRLGWNAAVSDWAKTDIFGDIKNPSGLNLFVKVNANLSSVNETILLDVPAKLDMPTASLLSAEYSVATGLLELTLDSVVTTPTPVLVRATKKLSSGVSFVKSEYRVISKETTDGNLIDVSSAYDVKFGALALGDNAFVSFQFVLASGQKSVLSSVKITVVA